MKKIEAHFETSDGASFTNQEEAERHQKLVTAIEKFNEANYAVQYHLALQVKTADGYPFQWRDVYLVCDGIYDVSYTRMYLWARQVRVEINEGEIVLVAHIQGEDKARRIRVGDVFYREVNAARRVYELKQQKLGWLQEDIDRLKSQWKFDDKEGN